MRSKAMFLTCRVGVRVRVRVRVRVKGWYAVGLRSKNMFLT